MLEGSKGILVGAARGAAFSASRYSVCTAMTSTLPGQEAYRSSSSSLAEKKPCPLYMYSHSTKA